MTYTTQEAVEAIYDYFEPEVAVPDGAPEDFVDWAAGQGFVLDESIIRTFELSAEGVFESLEDYAALVWPGVGWESLVEEGYWQGDHSDMVFAPVGEVFG